MRILIVNPNSTRSMTDKVAAAARDVIRSDTEIIAINPDHAPPSIQGYLDAAHCVPAMLAAVKPYNDIDAIVVACFDDTGIEAVRCTTEVPIIGIGEAAYHAASIISPRFSVVTTLSRSVAGLEANLLRYGFDRQCGRVRATDVAVLELEANSAEAVDKIRHEIHAAIAEDGAEAIVLGCAGMTDLMAQMQQEFGLPIVDGVTCAVTMAEALVACGLQTSKKCTYCID